MRKYEKVLGAAHQAESRREEKSFAACREKFLDVFTGNFSENERNREKFLDVFTGSFSENERNILRKCMYGRGSVLCFQLLSSRRITIRVLETKYPSHSFS